MKAFQLHRHMNLLAGFFVGSALIVFGAGLFVLLHQRGAFNRGFTVLVSFESGLGLRQGTDVQFNGVKIGRVDALDLMPVNAGKGRAGRVLLRLGIDRRYEDFITTRSVAFAERDKNLVSDRVVNIESPRGGGVPLHDGDTLRATDTRDIETVIGGLTRLLGKMDHLVVGVDEIVRRAGDPGTTVGAMLASRQLYDKLLSGANHLDTVLNRGQGVLSRVDHLGDTLYNHMGVLLGRADTTTASLQRTAFQVEQLGNKANGLADRGDVILRRVDQVLVEGAGKMDQAGDLMDAVSRLWFIRSKMEAPSEFPTLLNTANP